MVTNCCVKGCTNNSNSVNKSAAGISFHAFPSKPELRQKWLRAIGRPYWDPPSYTRICSTHFSIDQINNDGSRVRIKEEACPVDDLPGSNSFSASDVRVCRICLATDVRLFSLESGRLKVCMDSLAELNDKHNIMDLPQFVCYECGAQLLKYYRLFEKSLIAQATLLDIFADNGCVTKHLVKQRDRVKLNLNSTLGYSDPTDVIILDCGNDDFSDVEDESKMNVYKDELDTVDYESDNDINHSEKEQITVHILKRNKNSNKSINNRLRSRNKGFKHKNNLNDNFINVGLKSEVIENNSVTTEIDIVDKVDLKIEDATDTIQDNYIEKVEDPPDEKANSILKIEVDTLKSEKADSDVDNLATNFKPTRRSKRKLTATTKHKLKRTEYCDVGNLRPDKEELKEIFESLDEALKSSEGSDLNDDAAVNFTELSDSGSSDDENLESLKKKSKCRKLAQVANADNKKGETKKRTYKSRVKSGDKTPEETAIEKLKCYKIVDMSLQEQIEAWKTENEQPTQYSKFLCAVCTRKFVRKKAYEEHLPRHEMSRGEFECPVCRERFRNNTRLQSHTVRNHAKRYECEKCPKVFYNIDKAQRHEVFHSGQVYNCPHCAYSTTRRSTAWEHVRTQHAHAHHCARCGHTFINGKGLATHTAMQHQGEVGEPEHPFPCKECNIVFHSEGALRVHKMVSKQHKDEAKQSDAPPAAPTCRRCGAVFARGRELRDHTRAAHRAPPRPPRPRARPPAAEPYPRPCDHCSVELKSRFEHWCHVRREHPEQKHLYRSIVTAICATCGKGFQNTTMLHRHEQKHRGPATLACGACPRAFHDQYSLLRHARAHAAQRAHACADCGRAFKVKGNLERHRRYAHAPECPFLCTECGRAFKVKSNFKRHLRMHTGETPYECKFCGKKFRYWESLTLHEKHMHHKVPWPARDRARRPKRPDP